ERSTPCSAATRRAAGDAFTSPDSGAEAVAAAASWVGASAAAGADCCWGGAPAPAPAAESSSCPSPSSTPTTPPSAFSCFTSTPAFRAGTSTVILSVSSSTSVSPDATDSPSFLSQRLTVASTMDSPSGGTLIEIIRGFREAGDACSAHCTGASIFKSLTPRTDSVVRLNDAQYNGTILLASTHHIRARRHGSHRIPRQP